MVSRELEKECIIVFDEAHNIDNVCIEVRLLAPGFLATGPVTLVSQNRCVDVTHLPCGVQALSVNLRQQTLESANRNLSKLNTAIERVKATDAQALSHPSLRATHVHSLLGWWPSNFETFQSDVSDVGQLNLSCLWATPVASDQIPHFPRDGSTAISSVLFQRYETRSTALACQWLQPYQSRTDTLAEFHGGGTGRHQSQHSVKTEALLCMSGVKWRVGRGAEADG